MAVLKDLIVHGPSRFLNKAYFDSINADSVEANKGIFNKLIAKDSTLTNATVVGLLDVQGEMHTNSWSNSNIATIDGNFYITPTAVSADGTDATASGYTPTGTITYNNTNYTQMTITGTFDTSQLTLDGTSAIAWPANSYVIVTGDVLVGNEWYPLGTIRGKLSAQVAANTGSKTFTIIPIGTQIISGEVGNVSLTDGNGHKPLALEAIRTAGATLTSLKLRKVKISMTSRGSGSDQYALGIYMTAMGGNKKTFLDIYGGSNKNGVDISSTISGTTYQSGAFAKPTVRIGNLLGLPAFSLPNNTSVSPTGWGIYTTNGFFSGTIVSTQGKIGNFTLGTAIYSGTNSMNSNATGIYLGTDGIRNYNTADKYVNIQNGIITAKGVDLSGELTASKLTINSNAAINDASGLIRNDAVQVGGRNLVWDTEWKNISTRWTDWGTPTTREIVTLNGKQWLHLVTTANSYQGYSQSWTKREDPTSEIQAGDTVVFSYTAYAETAGQICTVGCHWNNSSGSIVNQSWFASSLTTTPKRYTSQPFTVPVNAVKFNVMIGQGVAQAQNLYITEVKIEKGNKATDWTPAPEDVASDIEGASKVADNYLKFEPNKGLMIADVSNGTSTIDNVTTGNVLIDDNSVDIRKGQKVLTTIDGDGLTVNDDTEAPVASFLKSGATVGKAIDGQSRMVTSGTGMQFIRRNGTTDEVLAHIGYGEGQAESGTLIKPYYSMGLRKSGTTIGNYSMASGYHTTASGHGSYAEGDATTASGSTSHAEGTSTISSSKAAHAEGHTTIASGSASHAEGFETKAIGDSAHAEGSNTEANAENSHAQNLGTVAQGFSQTVIGTYNQKQGSASNSRQMTDYAFIIGNGDKDTRRSNAFAVDWNGKVWHSGDGQHNIADYVQTSKGTFVSGYIVVYGKVAQLNFTFRNTSSIAGGATLYEGTLSSNSGWLPKQAARGVGYLGPTPFIMTIGAGGGIIIQNASQATVIIPSNKSAYCTVTYIMA